MSAEERKRYSGGGSKCCVVGCHNSASKNRELHFYRFPTANQFWKRHQREKWIKAVRLKNKNADNTPWEPKNSSYICSAHFVGGKKSNFVAHPAYVPSIFPAEYNKQKPSTTALARYERLQRRKTFTEKNEYHQDHKTATESDDDDVEIIIIEPDFTSDPAVAEDTLKLPPKRFHTRGVQTDKTSLDELPAEIDYFMCSRETFGFTSTAEVQVSLAPERHTKFEAQGFHGFSSIDSDEKLNLLSGVSFEEFNVLLKLLPKTNSMEISKENKLLIFLTTLRLGMTFESLSVIFEVHQSSISHTFLYVLEALYIGLEDIVRWPLRCVVERLLPNEFKKNYPKCRAIIDCSEIRIEHPSSLEQQVQAYLNYKSTQNVNFLIACTPDGYISFLSHCYGGCARDEFIAADSGILDLIEPGDVIIADKRFSAIKTDVEDKNAVFVVPPFALSKQLTQDGMSTTDEIASELIPIVHCIQKVKSFRIMQLLPYELVPHCDKVLRICCALVNLQSPIIKSKSGIACTIKF